MAAPSRQFIAALRRYGAESPEKKANLIAWKDAALESIADGGGGDLASGSGNGLSFTKMQGAMTNQEWFVALDLALAWIEAGIAPPGVILARIV